MNLLPTSLKKILFFIAVAFYPFKKSFSQWYQINHFQSTYDTLTYYNSVNNEQAQSGDSPYYWTKQFNFGFNFPFYNTQYSSIIIDNENVTYFPGSLEYNFFPFSGNYVIGNVINLSDLDKSEVRYRNDTVNNLKVLITQVSHLKLSH